MEPFRWSCPYCGHHTTITSPNYSHKCEMFSTRESRFEKVGLGYKAISCPNPDCSELSLSAYLQRYTYSPGSGVQKGDIEKEWRLMPQSNAKPQPDYIPFDIRSSYEEACLILNDSPRASATMSRRCLQRMIRDFWELPKGKMGKLASEFNSIQDKVDPATWEGIDAVRSVGSIGAHMEKDVDLIIDIDPEEANLLIQLIEMLFKDWYVASHDRQLRLEKIATLAQVKKNERTGANPVEANQSQETVENREQDQPES